MTALIVHFTRTVSGATAIEYALIASLISIVIVAAATSIGVTLENTFAFIATQF